MMDLMPTPDHGVQKAPLFDPYIAGTPQELRDLCIILDAFRYPIHRAQGSAWNPSAKPQRIGQRGNRQPVRCSTGATNQPAGGKAFGRSDEPGVAA